MFSDQTAEISLNAPSRCLDAVRADRVSSRFLAGTSCLGENNSLHVLRFHSELVEFGVDGILSIPQEVENLCSSPRDAELVLTTHASKATLWKIPSEIMTKSDELEYKPPDDEQEETTKEESSLSMEQVTTLDSPNRLGHVAWREEDANEVVTLDYSGQVTQWDMHQGRPVASQNVTTSSSITPPRLACDPHNVHSLAVTAGRFVRILDVRENSSSLPTETVSFLKCRSSDFTDVNYNPNKPNVLATGGQDGLLKFWDLRYQTKSPLLLAGRGGHTHWVSRVKYNPFHDQLVVSAGTDAIVNLWHMASISSAPPMQGDEADMRVTRHEHVDSVYDMAWGAADAWIYVSVGYDGKVVLNHVPSNEKYKILL